MMIESISYDIDRLISILDMEILNMLLELSIKGKGIKPPPGLWTLVKTELFADFLKTATLYLRYFFYILFDSAFVQEKMALTWDRVSNPSGIEVPTTLFHQFSELNK